MLNLAAVLNPVLMMPVPPMVRVFRMGKEVLPEQPTEKVRGKTLLDVAMGEALRCLKEEGEAMQIAEVAHELGLPSWRVQKALQELEKQGLVKKESVPKPKGGRYVVWSVRGEKS